MSSPSTPRRIIIYGSFVHSLSLTELEYLENTLLGIDEAGLISFIERDLDQSRIEAYLNKKAWQGVEVDMLSKGEFICPGLIDTHTHAPQYVNMSYGQEYELLDWLKNVTFPAEEKFKNVEYARRTYEGVVERVINAGTTTVCYYGTLHLTTQMLASICHRRGQRAFVGKCNMDRLSADNYQELSASQSLVDTEKFISFVRKYCHNPIKSTGSNGMMIENEGRGKSSSSDDLVKPILTPRFAIACSDELLTGLGNMLENDQDLHCQTHLAENPTEIEFTKSLFPFADSYTAVYDHFKLLQEKTVLAHCVHLEDSELDLIKARKSGVSHCPKYVLFSGHPLRTAKLSNALWGELHSSNFNLRSGISPISKMLDRDIKVSLGTDVSGGTSLGILSSIRAASTASKTLIFNSRDSSDSEEERNRKGQFESKHLSIDTLFYLATMGGAKVCCLEHRIGNFEVGKEFDALLISTGQKDRSSNSKEIEVDLEQASIDALNHEMKDDFPDEGMMFIEPEDDLKKSFEKFLFSGDDRNIAKVFVRGRLIGGTRF